MDARMPRLATPTAGYQSMRSPGTAATQEHAAEAAENEYV
jgi:hypothetical protein